MTNKFNPRELESIILDYRKRPYEGYIMYWFTNWFDTARFTVVFEFSDYDKETGVLSLIIDNINTYYYKVAPERYLDLRQTNIHNKK